MHFGGASARKTGLLDAVLDALKAEGIQYVTLGGVQANPTLSMARQGIELCLKEKVDFVLAVGGGSVIDSSKCIADGAGNPDVDVWTYFKPGRRSGQGIAGGRHPDPFRLRQRDERILRHHQ